MAMSEQISLRNPSERKRKSSESCSPPLQEEEQNDIDADTSHKKKKNEQSGAWTNLSLILSLQNKDISVQRKIEVAFNFVGSISNCRDSGPEVVEVSRLVSFLIDWIQRVLISAEKNKKIPEHESYLDYRAWAVLGFCLRKMSVGLSPYLLRSFTRVASWASLHLGDHLVAGQEFVMLFRDSMECLSLNLSSSSRAFYNAGIELWISCAVEIVNLVHKVLTKDNLGSFDAEVMIRFSGHLLELFSSFLRFHPKPKQIFRVFVDRLLAPLLELLVLLHIRADRWKYAEDALLGIIEDALSNGLFHPVHVSGFLSLRNFSAMQDKRELDGKNESYHSQLFKKLKKIVVEKRAVSLGGFGYLLHLFVKRVKSHKIATLKNLKNCGSGRSTKISEETQRTDEPLFGVFMMFLEPLLQECRRCADLEFSHNEEFLELRLVEHHCMIKSLNVTLTSFIHEKIYVRTKDTAEEAHFKFLKEVYDIILFLSGKIYQIWLSILNTENERIKKILPLIVKEIFVALRCFLEVEYRVVGNDLVHVWLMMFSYLAVQMPSADANNCSLLISEILNLGCLIIKVYSELRQVTGPLFAFCRAVRLFRDANGFQSSDYNRPFSCLLLSSELCLKSLTILLSSQEFRVAIYDAIRSVPERQASGFIDQVKVDVEESMEWIRHGFIGKVSLSSAKISTLTSNVLDLSAQAEAVGRILSEVYTLVLDSLTVTSTNSVFIGKSVEDLMKAMRPCFSHLFQNPSDGVDSFIHSFAGKNLSDYALTELKNDQLVAPDLMPWFFVFFFRMFLSCRSMHRQSISLMQPKSSREALYAMGNLFIISNGVQWRSEPNTLDEGYFSWAVKPSIPLLDVINSLPKVFLSNSCAAYPHLIYVLHLMALQRLNDLNRKIRAFDFLLEEDSKLKEIQLGNSDTYKASERLDFLLTASRKEAVEIVNFMKDYFPSVPSYKDSKTMQTERSGQLENSSVKECTWDMVICSIDENSLSVGIWWLLCRNIDVWIAHAANGHIKNYVITLLQNALTCGTAHVGAQEWCRNEISNKNISMHQVAHELLGDSVLYEQTVLCKHLASRFCHMLKKLLARVLDNFSSTDDDFYSLEKWPHMSSILIAGDAVDLHASSDLSPPSGTKLVGDKHCALDHEDQSSLSLNLLKACEKLLHLFCERAEICMNYKSFSLYMTSIPNLERHLLSNILNRQGDFSATRRFELFKLFISCRRAMKHLVATFVEDTDRKHSSKFSSVFNTSTLLWLLKSTSVLVELPHILLGGTCANNIGNLLSSLIDHTSYIFFTIGKQQMTYLFKVSLSDEKLIARDNLKKKVEFDLPDQKFGASKHIKTRTYLENILDMMEDQLREIFVTLETNLNAMEPEVSLSNFGWIKFSSQISCLQGFLWGLATALENFFKDYSDYNEQSLWWFSIHLLPSLSSRIVKFEKYLHFCIMMLLVDDSQAKVSLMNKMADLHVDSGFMKDVNLNNTCHSDIRVDSLDEEYKNNFTFKKARASKIRVKWIRNAFSTLQELDFSKSHFLRSSFLRSLLKGENTYIAFVLRQLFFASAAILKLNCMLLFPKDVEPHAGFPKLTSNLMATLVGTSHILLQGVAEMVSELDPSSIFWLDGPIKYLEVVGSLIHFSDPNLSELLYAQVIESHMRCLGTCIALQGKAASLSSHEAGSTTKMLPKEIIAPGHEKKILDSGKCIINTLKAQLRTSFIEYIRKPAKSQVKTALLAIEKALVGLTESSHTAYEITTGDIDGGKVSSIVAGGIDAFDLLLEHASGKKHIIKQSVSRLIGCLFNIVFHLQKSTFFYSKKLHHMKLNVNPDAGSVVLMCVEVLNTVVGRHSFQLDSSHVSQCLNVSIVLFNDFHHLSTSCEEHYFFPSSDASEENSSSLKDVCHHEVAHHFSINLYCSCCKLLYTILKHQIREVKRCIALLQTSVNTLLLCLETVDTNLAGRKKLFSWNMLEAVKCASFLRRIYEEIRQQKDALGNYSIYFLSTYISIYCGSGPLGLGIKREIDEALRPGVYSLIDICTTDDFQQLHTVLSEGPCRTTLATLLEDYKLNFQFEGKV